MDAGLQQFVRDALGRGLSRAAIRERLLAAGWRPSEVDAALGAFAEADFPIPVPRRRPYIPARVAFLHLVLFATLFVTAYNCGAVLFTLIEKWIPDAARPSYAGGSLMFLRGAIASLVIALPLFVWMNRLIGRAFEREPEQRASTVRKWLTSLTLFVAALTMIGDLVVLVMMFLSGELMLRVGLKVAVVFAVAGTVFWHYLGEQRREDDDLGQARRPSLWLPRVAIAVAALTTIAGLIVSGTPQRARNVAIDEQRSNDLMAIASSIDEHWRQTAALPDSLGALDRGRTWIVARQDPATGEPYGYRIVDSTRYELCATFDASADTWNEQLRIRENKSRFSVHPAGRSCFELEVTRPAAPNGPPLR